MRKGLHQSRVGRRLTASDEHKESPRSVSGEVGVGVCTRALVVSEPPAQLPAGFLGPDRFTAGVLTHVESARSGQKAQLVRGHACNFFKSPS